MSDAELIAIVEQADREMTPGEWMVYGSDRYCKEMPVAAVISSRKNEQGTALGRIVVWPGRDAFGDEEAAGIVALRNNAGAIVLALRRLTQERDAARDAVETAIRSMSCDADGDVDWRGYVKALLLSYCDGHEKRAEDFAAERDSLRERCAELEAKLLK